MAISKSQIDKQIKIKKIRGQLAANLNKLQADKKYYLEKAKAAKQKGDSASYSLARSGLSSTVTQQKRTQEMLLNVDITNQMRSSGVTTREFLQGMNKIFDSISKLNKKINLRETKAQLKKAMSGMEVMQANLDNLLTEAESGFSVAAGAESTVSDSELDRMINAEMGIGGIIESEELDRVLQEIENKPAAAEQKKAQVSQGGYKDIFAETEPSTQSAQAPRSHAKNAQDFQSDSQNESIDSIDAQNRFFKFDKYEYAYPSLDLLDYAPHSEQKAEENAAAARDAATRAEEILSELKVEAKVSGFVVGAAYTVIEMVMPAGVSVNKVEPLIDDITMRLGKRARFQIPLEGKNAFGIEIPNVHRETISMREALESESFADADNSGIKFCLAVNSRRETVIRDLTKAPHMIIAGSTNSGKSCFLHAVINSIMYKYSPDEVRFLIMDFKRVEMAMYNGLPFLLTDKVIDNEQDALQAFGALNDEMESRYEILTQYKCRSVAEYNKKFAGQKSMPYIAVFVDEYADISASPLAKEFDLSIRRLAQKARASGIHLIFATQRPSTDIISGTIKNNFPTQVAFKVARKEDSRTTLAGQSGAETLLGYGDMLYNEAAGSGLVRLQAPLITGAEIDRVAAYITSRSVKKGGNGNV